MADGTRLSGRKVAVFLAEGFEDLEFWVTLMRLREEAAETIVMEPVEEPRWKPSYIVRGLAGLRVHLG